MNLSISNIAWSVEEEREVALLLRDLEVRYVDIAPTKYWPKVADATRDEVTRLAAWWQGRGFGIAGMQSLLFGRPDLKMFADKETRCAMLKHLVDIMNIAAWLRCGKLVFGSPTNRSVAGVPKKQVDSIALEFFARLGDEARSRDLLLCIEAAPMEYGGDYLTTTREVVAEVIRVNHPNIRVQLDTGILVMTKDVERQSVYRWTSLIGHVHLSEPMLETFGVRGKLAHERVVEALKALPTDVVRTIEMRQVNGADTLNAIESSIRFVKEVYV